MDCDYCHNKHLLDNYNTLDTDDIIREINYSEPFINSVIFSGGEPTLHLQEIIKLSNYSKTLNLDVGIHTNGYNFDNVKHLVDNDIIDKFFVDVKMHFNCVDRIKSFLGVDDYKNTLKSIKYINQKGKGLELRTTVLSNIHNYADIEMISKTLSYEVDKDINYVLQQGIVDGIEMPLEKLFKMKEIADNYLNNVKIRTKLGEKTYI